MKKLNVDSLIFEVTKRCNMSCEHCLRGDARNIDMSKEVVDAILDKVSFTGAITFTGGEPTLNLPLIEYIFSELRRREISFSYFWMATNGLGGQLELATILMSYYNDAQETDMNSVTLSIDPYHDEVDLSPLKLLNFYTGDKESVGTLRLINRGRAMENGLYATDREIIDTFEVTNTNNAGEVTAIDQLYVDALGRCYPDCDMSYEDQDDMGGIHIKKLTSAAIKKFNKSHAEPMAS